MDSIRSTLEAQFSIAWQLLQYHLHELGDTECLWRPADRGLHVWNESGTWRADWPDSETYDIGPASIAWLTWHMIYWWSMTLDHAFGEGTLTRDAVTWPGNMDDVKRTIVRLQERWISELATLSDAELASSARTKWPMTDRPFVHVIAWLNLELMKNASEIGYCRFLYATRPLAGSSGR